jgi:plasmid stabilization system protein ParE
VTPPLQIEIADDAREQIAAAAAWWAENRLSAPDAIREELDWILDLLSVQPEIGTKARCARLSGVRRVLLSRIGYYLYYRVAGVKLQVLAFWHASRGREPSL